MVCPGRGSPLAGACRSLLAQSRAHGVQRGRPVGRDQADAGAPVEQVGLVQGALVAYRPQQFGGRDGVAGKDRLAEPGVAGG